MVLQPVAGYLASSFTRFGVRLFGLQLPHWGWDDPALHSLFSTIHVAIAWSLVALICLHLLAVVHHALQGRSEIVRRMLPGRAPAGTGADKPASAHRVR
ncbi:MAG: hypothetical protein NVS3B2_18010 [Ramlibacter sp.]